jgi:hypothetical protein
VTWSERRTWGVDGKRRSRVRLGLFSDPKRLTRQRQLIRKSGNVFGRTEALACSDHKTFYAGFYRIARRALR